MSFEFVFAEPLRGYWLLLVAVFGFCAKWVACLFVGSFGVADSFEFAEVVCSLLHVTLPSLDLVLEIDVHLWRGLLFVYATDAILLAIFLCRRNLLLLHRDLRTELAYIFV